MSTSLPPSKAKRWTRRTNQGAVDSRIDAPHIPARSEDSLEPPSQAVAPSEGTAGTTYDSPLDDFPAQTPEESEMAQLLTSPASLWSQARQLAGYLRHRQDELDRREAQLNARMAQFDSVVRIARLSLIREEADIQGCDVPSPCTSDLEQDQSKQVQLERQKIDTHREASLQLVRQLMAGVERQRQAMQTKADAMIEAAKRPSPDLLHREQQVLQQTHQLEQKRQELAEAEEQIETHLAEARRSHDDLVYDRERLHEEARASESRRAQEHRQSMMRLARQQERLEMGQNRLEQSQRELNYMRQETRQIRHAAEAMWHELSRNASRDQLGRLLRRLRERGLDEDSSQTQATCAASLVLSNTPAGA